MLPPSGSGDQSKHSIHFLKVLDDESSQQKSGLRFGWGTRFCGKEGSKLVRSYFLLLYAESSLFANWTLLLSVLWIMSVKCRLNSASFLALTSCWSCSFSFLFSSKLAFSSWLDASSAAWSCWFLFSSSERRSWLSFSVFVTKASCS